MDELRRKATQPLAIPEQERPVFLMAARLVSWKGQLEFIQAFARIVRSEERATLVLAGGGDGDYTKAVHRMIVAQGIEDSIVVLGRRDDVPALMRWADVVVSPSITPEPFGRVCIEAQGVGTPVLATALGGPTETVVDAETGWLITSPSIDSMELGIRRCLADRDRWKQMGLAGQHYVDKNYSGTYTANRFESIVLGEDG